MAAHHGMVLHVAWLAHRLVLLHDVGFPRQHAVAVEAAEMLQVPVLALGLRVLQAEDQLWESTLTNMKVTLIRRVSSH